MALFLRLIGFLLVFSTLSACGGGLGGLTSSSQGSSASSGDRGLIAYQQVRARSLRASNQHNPSHRPRRITDTRKVPFNNAIPFFPRGRGEYVSSDYGWRNLWGRADFHCGVDVVAEPGTPVLAVTSGEVTFVRSAGARGGVVLYVNGRQYTYWHVVPARGLRAGRRVRAGQRLGTLANWGGNTHLHYAVYLTGNNDHPNARKDRNCVDPMALAAEGIF